MLRTIRLTASVLVLTSGIWLASAFLLTEIESPREPASPAIPVGSATGSVTVSPLIRQPDLNPQPWEGLAFADDVAAADGLAEVASLLTAVEKPLQPFRPLPPAPAAVHQPPPSLPGVYRSALDLPPPPLLDAHAPPPLAGNSTWRRPSSREEGALIDGRWAADERVSHSRAVNPDVATRLRPAESYVVRDGDDLTAIAVRIYGHPAAATLLWQANRDRLAAADLLPVGMPLRVPPLSQAQGLPDRPGGWIEPAGAL